MRKTQLESTLEGRLRKAVHQSGGLCIKLPAILYRGIPDRMILLPGSQVIFVELKAGSGTLSKPQVRFRNILCSMGFEALIIRGETQLEEFIRDRLYPD